MSRGLPVLVKENLEKCQSTAIAAVEVYNKPGPRFRTAHYIVLIIMSWTALFHALFYKRRQNPWYQKGGRYIKVDGDNKHWELSECLVQFYGGNHPPARKNLEFLIGLRNKIEHRNLPELDAGLYGECQAALLNLEDFVCTEFGAKYAMACQLAISLQFTSLMPEAKKEAAKVLASKGAKSIREYVENFRGKLPSSTLNSTKYSFNVYLVPKVTNRKNFADAVIEFIKVDEASQEEVERLEKLNILIKEKNVPISNLGLHKPTEVVKKVNQSIPFVFNMSHHTSAWKHFKIRPQSKAKKPEQTIAELCIYDSAHADYLYADAWVAKLIKELSVEPEYRKIIGVSPKAK